MTAGNNTMCKRRVFIVDDDKDTLSVLSALFVSCGAEVFGVSQSTKALDDFVAQTIGGTPFDLIALDIRMPQVDGNELARRLREKGYTGPVVALTAAVSGGGRNESKDSGFDYYFGKQQFTKEVVTALLGAAPKK